MEHLELTLKELARFHATGYHHIQTSDSQVLKKELSFIWNHGEGTLCTLRPEDENSFSREIGLAAVNGGIEVACRKLKDSDPDLWQRFKNYDVELGGHHGYAPSGKFDVFSHGDCWSNNFLFKYNDNGDPIDVRFLDLQESKRTRPTFDLSYLVSTCTTEETREKYLDQIFKTYHCALLKTLATYGYEKSVYPWDTFMEDYKITMGAGIFFGLLNIQVY